VALSQDTLAVGTPNEASSAIGVDGIQDDNSASYSGAVYIFRRSLDTWVQEAYIKASNTGSGDNFGNSVALSADSLAVGARFEDSAATGTGSGQNDDNTASNSGAVYMFRHIGIVWAQEVYLKASNTDSEDNFGISISLMSDTLAVGAHREASKGQGVDGVQANNEAQGSGAVYLFQRTGEGWVQKTYLKASNTDSGDAFGTSVSLSGDTLAIGAPLEDSAASGISGNQNDNTSSDSGAAYIFY